MELGRSGVVAAHIDLDSNEEEGFLRSGTAKSAVPPVEMTDLMRSVVRTKSIFNGVGCPQAGGFKIDKIGHSMRPIFLAAFLISGSRNLTMTGGDILHCDFPRGGVFNEKSRGEMKISRKRNVNVDM